MTMTMPKRAGVYCRLSYAPDGSVEKVERQEADCRQLAQRLGWPVSEAHIYPDNSRSAWQRNRNRPQWDRMLKAVDRGEIDAIIVYHGDRLIRQPHDLEMLISIADSKGVRIASPSGTRDLDNADDRFILRIEAAQACRESDNISRRVRRTMKARRERGLTQAGGNRPFGYGVQTGTRTKVDRETGEMIEVPVYDTTQQVLQEAKYLAEAGDRLLAGQSQAGVVRWLGEESVVTTEGNPFTVKSLRNLMLAPRNAGLIEHEGQLHEAAWEEIFSRETWEDIKRIYASSAEEHPYQGRQRKYLLSGAQGAECVMCRVPVRTKPTGGRNRKSSRIYYCPKCRGVGRNVELLDAYVEGRTVQLLNDARFSAEIHRDDDQPDIGKEITKLERRKKEVREQLENLADHPDVDAALAMTSLASFDRKIDGLRNQLVLSARRRRLARMVGITREHWEAEPIDIRSATVRDLWRVVLKPTAQRGPGFDTSAVELHRRPLSAQ
jgi:DNA invertase Pin-like site-specific DNA recombinase/Zn-finger nucleic acid-binding protein